MTDYHPHEIPIEKRQEHEQKWKTWAIDTLNYLRPILSLEDKVPLTALNLEENNLIVLLGLLTDLEYHKQLTKS